MLQQIFFSFSLLNAELVVSKVVLCCMDSLIVNQIVTILNTSLWVNENFTIFPNKKNIKHIYFETCNTASNLLSHLNFEMDAGSIWFFSLLFWSVGADGLQRQRKKAQLANTHAQSRELHATTGCYTTPPHAGGCIHLIFKQDFASDEPAADSSMRWLGPLTA